MRPVSDSSLVGSILDDASTPAEGAANPNVTIAMFTDARCVACRADEPTLKRLIARDPGVRILFKEWPIFGEDSRRAARYALAANYQGGYPRLHAALSDSNLSFTPANLDSIARGAGLDVDRLHNDLTTHSDDIDAALALTNRQAQALGLEGAPSYVMGRYLAEGRLGDWGAFIALGRVRSGGGY